MTELGNEQVAYFDGEILPESRVAISFRDSGFIYDDGVFDTRPDLRAQTIPPGQSRQTPVPLAQNRKITKSMGSDSNQWGQNQWGQTRLIVRSGRAGQKSRSQSKSIESDPIDFIGV